MKVYFPTYYNNFHCIADKCTHSCCIGWEVAVDDLTLKKYEQLGERSILEKITDGCIGMTEEGRCPFLRADGLCHIIAEHGEGMVGEICREHPRFYHAIGDRVEMGIGASCPEAARLILSSDGYDDFDSAERDCSPAEETDFDMLTHRNGIFSILSDRNERLADRLEMITSLYEIGDFNPRAEQWNERLSTLEYLYPEHQGLFEVGLTDGREKMEEIFERFFAYLVYRHCSVADCYEDLQSRLAFCLVVLSVLENHTAKTDCGLNEAIKFVEIISEEIEYCEENTESLIMDAQLALM